MPSTSDPDAADLVKKARYRLEMTQSEFAARLGVTKRTIIRWEKDGSLASFLNLALTAHIVRGVDAQLADELKAAALVRAKLVGLGSAEIEAVAPPPLTAQGIVAAQVVQGTADALGSREAKVRGVLAAVLRYAEDKGLTLTQLRRELERG